MPRQMDATFVYRAYAGFLEPDDALLPYPSRTRTRNSRIQLVVLSEDVIS
jgi:hypothetical protein